MNNYPNTKIQPITDHYFESSVTENYRWLEEENSTQTQQWIEQQASFTQEYFHQLGSNDLIEQTVAKYASQPLKRNVSYRDGYFYFELQGEQSQPIIYRHQADDEPCIFIDPNQFSADGTSSLHSYSLSRSGKTSLVAISDNGTDLLRVEVIDLASQKVVDRAITNACFMTPVFLDDEYFFYSCYPQSQGNALTEKNDQHQVWLHKVGTAQTEDQLVFGDENKYLISTITLSECAQHAVFSSANDTATSQLWYKSINQLTGPAKPLTPDNQHSFSTVYATDTHVYAATNFLANNNRLLAIPYNADLLQAEEIIAQQETVNQFSVAGNRILVQQSTGSTATVSAYEMNGNPAFDLFFDQPGLVEISITESDQATAIISFQNHITPPEYYGLDLATGHRQLYWQSTEKLSGVECKEVWFSSKDGTRVPMTICHNAGLQLTGDHPTILYGYGGFNVPVRAWYSAMRAAWVELGGVYVVANLRGGGEFGQDWHLAGCKLNKQNVFDDFISAGEELVKQGYCSNQTLGILGGSNGGLLVGACLTQRPDLFAAAVPTVGVFDMLRFQHYTCGGAWVYDYGSSDESQEMFDYLLSYSPLHNVEDGQAYPATLVVTADHDDRVVPAHSFKFIAELQAKQQSPAPCLIRITRNSGHGAGRSLDQLIAEFSDVYRFFMANLAT